MAFLLSLTRDTAFILPILRVLPSTNTQNQSIPWDFIKSGLELHICFLYKKLVCCKWSLSILKCTTRHFLSLIKIEKHSTKTTWIFYIKYSWPHNKGWLLWLHSYWRWNKLVYSKYNIGRISYSIAAFKIQTVSPSTYFITLDASVIFCTPASFGLLTAIFCAPLIQQLDSKQCKTNLATGLHVHIYFQIKLVKVVFF